MAPELPEPGIRPVVRERIREGVLDFVTCTIPTGVASRGGRSCVICGFTIVAGRNKCALAGLHAHERCAVIWREESDRIF